MVFSPSFWLLAIFAFIFMDITRTGMAWQERTSERHKEDTWSGCSKNAWLAPTQGESQQLGLLLGHRVTTGYQTSKHEKQSFRQPA